MSKRDLTIFWCPKLAAKMTLHGCINRHRAANAKTKRPGQIAMIRSGMGPCRGCDIGKDHRQGKRRREAPNAELSPKPTQQGKPLRRPVCLGCGQEFQPTHRQRTCSTDCKLLASRNMEAMVGFV